MSGNAENVINHKQHLIYTKNIDPHKFRETTRSEMAKRSQLTYTSLLKLIKTLQFVQYSLSFLNPLTRCPCVSLQVLECEFYLLELMVSAEIFGLLEFKSLVDLICIPHIFF